MVVQGGRVGKEASARRPAPQRGDNMTILQIVNERVRGALGDVSGVQMAGEDGRSEGFAARLKDDLGGGKPRPLAVDVRSEPGEERRELAARDAGPDRRVGALRG